MQISACVAAAVLLLFVLVLSGRSARVQQQFEDRTAELAARNRQLRNEIAEREAAEERERETQRSFLDGLAFAGIGSWDHDLDSGQLTGTAELCRIYGLPGTSVLMDLDTLLERVHPDDLPRYQEALEACTVGGGFLSLDLRVMHPGGEMRWISARARHRLDRVGRPHVVGVSWDITDRVEASARAKLLAMTFERGGEAIFISDPEFRIVEVNPAFAGLTGIGQGLAPGMDAAEIFAERGNREQFRSYAAIALDRGSWQGEIWGRGSGGIPRPFWLVLAVVRDERGEPSSYVGSFVDISERKGAEEKIEFLAHHDALTGLPNRFSLQSRVDQALSQAVRSGERLALMFIDMDRFKLINDSLGHDVGDQLLLEIARRLRTSVRSSDIVARLGGDEFVVALPGAGDDDAIARMAEKLRQELSAPYNLRARLLHSSPSIGIAIAPEHGSTVETLMRNADAAMYRAKDVGRNNFQFFDRALSERARDRLELAADLRGALEREEFRLHFQPQVRSEDGAFVAAEALIRWQHPQRGLVAPDQFISVAEEFGLIDAIGDWALNAACRELATLNALGISGLRVCVNLSAKQLRDRELPERVAAAITASGIAAADLELELTESMAMQEPQSTIALLKRLYDSGVGLAIDDFGTGYSSLSYLKMLPLHNIKLDRSFVRDIDAEPGGRAICSATVAMAHALGIKVVAEGV
jgi:diguanylate cyclase (GGDEF)-like protein/PAS domain S-box-containing protein